MIDQTMMKASDDCLEIYKAVTERDGGCETCAIFFNEADSKILYSDPLGIGRALPKGVDSYAVMELCTQIAKQIKAVAFVVTTNIRMLSQEDHLKEIERQKEEDPDEEPDNPGEFMDSFPEHVVKGVAQFLVFRWGATYQRILINKEHEGFYQSNMEFVMDGNFQVGGWEGD